MSDFPSKRKTSASGTVSNVLLVPAPLPTQKLRIRQTYISTNFMVEVTFHDTTVGEVWSQFVSASGGSVVPQTRSAWFECSPGEALTYSHASGGASTVSVNYEIVNV